jgi:hypothetical protein
VQQDATPKGKKRHQFVRKAVANIGVLPMRMEMITFRRNDRTPNMEDAYAVYSLRNEDGKET